MITDNIRLIRITWRYGHEGMAELLNCSAAKLKNYETGLTKVPPEILFLLEDHTAIPMRRLYWEKIEKTEIPEVPLQKGIGKPNMVLLLLQKVEALEKRLNG